MRRLVRAMVLVGRGFRGEAISLRAAALTYLTLFALVPLLAVLYSVVDLFTGEAQIHDRVQSYVNSQLGIGAGAAIAGALTTFTSKATVKTLGAIGFAVLLVSVLSLLWNIESAFNHIYAVKKPRSPVQRLLKYWSFLTLGPMFLTLSVYVTWTISRMQETHGAHNHPNHSEVLHVLAALSSIAITYAALAFLYKVIPNARVRLRSALLAAFVAGSAWEVAKFFFAWASGRMVQVHRIYGSVAVLPITLTWIYISWFIALIGCRVCYALDASRKPEPHPALEAALAREAFVMRTTVALAQLHRERGAPVRIQALMGELGVTSRLAREGLAALAGAGLAVETKQGGWLLSRDPSRITLAEVRAAGRASLRFPAQLIEDEIGAAIENSLTRADGAAAAALGESLESLLRRFEAAPVQGVTTPEPLPLGVGQSARKPA
ncbi:MAG TPA: YihY/virulence factor BrkB family protein [Myxococcales bacterium]|nr:YihY/virulence factor BrkB family protein [Myxococcales bacterium]